MEMPSGMRRRVSALARMATESAASTANRSWYVETATCFGFAVPCSSAGGSAAVNAETTRMPMAAAKGAATNPIRRSLSSARRTRAAGSSDRSDGICAALPGTDAHHVLERQHPHLAVADRAGLGGLHHRLDHLAHPVVLGEHLDAQLGDEVDLVLGPAVGLAVASLPPEALHLRHGEALHADALQCVLDLVEAERLDHRHHELHRTPSLDRGEPAGQISDLVDRCTQRHLRLRAGLAGDPCRRAVAFCLRHAATTATLDGSRFAAVAGSRSARFGSVNGA